MHSLFNSHSSTWFCFDFSVCSRYLWPDKRYYMKSPHKAKCDDLNESHTNKISILSYTFSYSTHRNQRVSVEIGRFHACLTLAHIISCESSEPVGVRIFKKCVQFLSTFTGISSVNNIYEMFELDSIIIMYAFYRNASEKDTNRNRTDWKGKECYLPRAPFSRVSLQIMFCWHFILLYFIYFVCLQPAMLDAFVWQSFLDVYRVFKLKYFNCNCIVSTE